MFFASACVADTKNQAEMRTMAIIHQLEKFFLLFLLKAMIDTYSRVFVLLMATLLQAL